MAKIDLSGIHVPTLEEIALSMLSPYAGITFEAKAEYDGSDKKLYNFDQSLSRLKAAGYTRHPRPQEVFGLLIANLENKVTAEQKSIAEDMLNSYSEWFSTAMERNKDKLTIYTDPEGLVWNGSTYVMENFTFESKRDFSIAGIPSTKLVDLNQFGNDLVEFLYTRKFAQLPQAMREDGKRAQLYLPADRQILPAGRGSFSGRFDVSYYYVDRASRGVVPSSRAKK